MRQNVRMGMMLATHGTRIPDVTITLGMRLRAARSTADVTQARMSELLGVNRRTVVRWETDETTAPIAIVLSYSVLTDVNLGWLQTGVPGQPSEDYAEIAREHDETRKAAISKDDGPLCAPRDLNPEPIDYGFGFPNTVSEFLTACGTARPLAEPIL